MLQELIDELIDYISKSGREEDVAGAKEEFFKDAGGLFGEEDSFERRIGAFLEWYIVDRRMGGGSVLEEFTAKVDDEDKKRDLLTIKESIRSIFEVTKVYADKVYLKDLDGGRKYYVFVPGDMNFFKNRNIIETRLFPFNKHYVLSKYYIFHPEKMKKFIAARLKDAAERHDPGTTINRLANMSLKWEKYRNYRIEEIYKVRSDKVA